MPSNAVSIMQIPAASLWPKKQTFLGNQHGNLAQPREEKADLIQWSESHTVSVLSLTGERQLDACELHQATGRSERLKRKCVLSCQTELKVWAGFSLSERSGRPIPVVSKGSLKAWYFCQHPRKTGMFIIFNDSFCTGLLSGIKVMSRWQEKK